MYDSLGKVGPITRFIYVIRPDRTDYGHITFLFSTINHETDYTVYDFGYVRETTNDEYREKYQAIYDPEADPDELLRKVREAVDDFVGEAEQFDDLTMMCVEYRGKGAREGA